MLPLYFWLLRGIPAPDILGHRAAWSARFLGAVRAVVRGWDEVRRARPWLGRRTVTAVLIGASWLTRIWRTTHRRVLDASLGDFLNPPGNVVLGRLALGERLGGARAAPGGLAGVGMGTRVVLAGRLPWPAVVPPLCLGLYGLLRKGVPVPGVAALFRETAMLAPLAVAWLSWREAWSVGDPRQTRLLVGTGRTSASTVRVASSREGFPTSSLVGSMKRSRHSRARRLVGSTIAAAAFSSFPRQSDQPVPSRLSSR